MTTQNKIYVNRKFNCAQSTLFEWLTNPQLIAQWFGPKQLTIGKVESDVQIGGNYSIELQKPNGQNIYIEGEYLELNSPENLTYTFVYRGMPTPPPDSTVKIILESISEKETQLNLIQEFVVAPSNMENRTENWNRMFTLLNEKVSA